MDDETLEKEFQNSVNTGRNLKNIGEDDLLILYGLYKQITEGDCLQPQPWSNQVIARARWNEWYKNGNTPRNVVIQKYIDKIRELVQKQ